MSEEVREKVEQVLKGENLGYAYFHTNNDTKMQQLVMNMTPENIANFLGKHFLDANKVTLTDQVDQLILETCGGFIDYCPNQKLCVEINKYLAPIQMGDVEAKDIPLVTKEEYDEYGRWEEEQETMAEMYM